MIADPSVDLFLPLGPLGAENGVDRCLPVAIAPSDLGLDGIDSLVQCPTGPGQVLFEVADPAEQLVELALFEVLDPTQNGGRCDRLQTIDENTADLTGEPHPHVGSSSGSTGRVGVVGKYVGKIEQQPCHIVAATPPGLVNHDVETTLGQPANHRHVALDTGTAGAEFAQFLEGTGPNTVEDV